MRIFSIENKESRKLTKSYAYQLKESKRTEKTSFHTIFCWKHKNVLNFKRKQRKNITKIWRRIKMKHYWMGWLWQRCIWSDNLFKSDFPISWKNSRKFVQNEWKKCCVIWDEFANLCLSPDSQTTTSQPATT